jgi:elongation factor P--beta-lysine ligase
MTTLKKHLSREQDVNAMRSFFNDKDILVETPFAQFQVVAEPLSRTTTLWTYRCTCVPMNCTKKIDCRWI